MYLHTKCIKYISLCCEFGGCKKTTKRTFQPLRRFDHQWSLLAISAAGHHSVFQLVAVLTLTDKNSHGTGMLLFHYNIFHYHHIKCNLKLYMILPALLMTPTFSGRKKTKLEFHPTEMLKSSC